MRLWKADRRYDEIVGTVTYVIDGDTVKLAQPDGSEITIRLEGIDAPERGQPFSDESKQWLADATSQQVVKVIALGTDRYGRTLANLYINERWLNRDLVASGLAWHYPRYNQDARLAYAQSQARTVGRGLWKESQPIAPWDYRNDRRLNGSGGNRDRDDTGSIDAPSLLTFPLSAKRS